MDEQTFRNVVGHFMSGVTIITAHDGGRDFGVTASSVASLSVRPPTMTACLNRDSRTGGAVHRNGAYVINVLSEEQGDLAQRFATRADDKFAGVEVERGTLGPPIISSALAHLECEVTEEVQGGTHSVFLGAVRAGRARPGNPLAYFRGGFGRFDAGADQAVYQQLRQGLIDRHYPPGAALQLGDLADELGVERPAVYYALTKLSGDGLVERREHGGYTVVPVDAAAADTAFDARCGIEIGALELSVGRTTPEDLQRLRAALEAMTPLIRHDEHVDVARYLEANNAFHEQLVALGHNDALLTAYRALSVKGVMAQALSRTTRTSDAIISDQVQIVEAIERGDLDSARRALLEHTKRAKARAREDLTAVGGKV